MNGWLRLRGQRLPIVKTCKAADRFGAISHYISVVCPVR